MRIFGNALSRNEINPNFPRTNSSSSKDEYEGISRSVTKSQTLAGMFRTGRSSLQGRNLFALPMMSGPDPAITIGSLNSWTFSQIPGSALMTDDRKTRPRDPTGKTRLPGLAFLVYSFALVHCLRSLFLYRCLSTLINKPKINSEMRHDRRCLGERLSHISWRGWDESAVKSDLHH